MSQWHAFIEIIKYLLGNLLGWLGFPLREILFFAFIFFNSFLLSQVFFEPKMTQKLLYLVVFAFFVLSGSFIGGIYFDTIIGMPSGIYWWVSLMLILFLSYIVMRFITSRRLPPNL